MLSRNNFFYSNNKNLGRTFDVSHAFLKSFQKVLALGIFYIFSIVPSLQVIEIDFKLLFLRVVSGKSEVNTETDVRFLRIDFNRSCKTVLIRMFLAEFEDLLHIVRVVIFVKMKEISHSNSFVVNIIRNNGKIYLSAISKCTLKAFYQAHLHSSPEIVADFRSKI